ncbi:tRNA preQ1(34) S-adenosylmethionine ribosyltransferase-isomerase QueA [Candidatus Uhrbacteria bacterium CG_4_9_14_3_um_filter_36_7]|uniref:S-adenosylmethionine:tRNA ribosyltransferase-isomerase n=1 Tax=Candidatus Uhrbacteria bacterium CG_4_9_14_3_um_filter_36_7 TaxID=1975033 RepID=A0A2M7XI86_9BACT|nr:MAG: tRNA preQ1(34) S-adenosylmethionine ribosyltransferase-isomerase QueA [Candidatus Uhrbacteria bacterium CG_4_9_14_3_um_filter_36_7]
MQTNDFFYKLPFSSIAQYSAQPRDHSRLLVLNRNTGEKDHLSFFELGNYLDPGDVLVFNQSKVFRARLSGKANGKALEIFLLRCLSESINSSYWEVLAKPGKILSQGTEINLSSKLVARVFSKQHEVVQLVIDASKTNVLEFAHEFGQIPIPPYVKQIPEKLSDYQTVYAKQVGSVAAPTAGFHFTDRLLQELKQQGIQMEFITLHVGLGTFLPVKTETLEQHEIHSEYVEVDEITALRINKAKKDGRRVIAVGTTTVRTLEGIVKKNGSFEAYRGEVNLFIKPGFSFEIIDAMITNFHLPKSTLLALVSAFASRETIIQTYEEAIQKDYRFFSFGDAMLII